MYHRLHPRDTSAPVDQCLQSRHRDARVGRRVNCTVAVHAHVLRALRWGLRLGGGTQEVLSLRPRVLRVLSKIQGSRVCALDS